jgi:hypothetical protein
MPAWGRTYIPFRISIYTQPSGMNDNVPKVVMDNDFIGDDVETEMHVLGVAWGF